MDWWMPVAIIEFVIIAWIVLQSWLNYRWQKQEVEMMGACVE